MDIGIEVLFFLHLTALAAGGAASFGIPAVGSRLPGASVEARPVLFGVMDRLSSVGRGAMVVLIVTGPLLVWMKYGGVDGFSHWFWVKMVLVVLLLVGIVMAGLNGKKAERGDSVALKRAPMLGGVTMGLFLLVILSAVFAFNGA